MKKKKRERQMKNWLKKELIKSVSIALVETVQPDRTAAKDAIALIDSIRDLQREFEAGRCVLLVTGRSCFDELLTPLEALRIRNAAAEKLLDAGVPLFDDAGNRHPSLPLAIDLLAGSLAIVDLQTARNQAAARRAAPWN